MAEVEMLIWYIRNLQMYLMCGLQKMYNSNILFFWPGRVFHGCVSSQNSCIDIECIICDHINDHVKTKRSKNWQKKKKCGLLCWADLFFLMIISCCVLCVIHFFSFSLLVYKVSLLSCQHVMYYGCWTERDSSSVFSEREALVQRLFTLRWPGTTEELLLFEHLALVLLSFLTSFLTLW